MITTEARKVAADNNLTDLRATDQGLTGQSRLNGLYFAVTNDGVFLNLMYKNRGAATMALRKFVPAPVAAHTPIMLPADYRPMYIDDNGRPMAI